MLGFRSTVRTLFLTFLIASVGYGTPQETTKPATSAEQRAVQWRQDVEHICENFVRLHRDAFRFANKKVFERERNSLLQEIPKLSDDQVMIRLAALFTPMRDAHSGVHLQPGQFTSLPIGVAHLSDGFYLLRVPHDQPELLESKIEGVGGKSIQEMLAAFSTVIPHENEIGVANGAGHLLARPTVLHAIGLSDRSDAAEYALRLPNGQKREVTFKLKNDGEKTRSVTVQRTGKWLAESATGNYWYRVLPDHNAIYVGYLACAEQQGYPFQKFASEVLEEIEKQQLEKLIIDIRFNGGGSELVAQPLFRALESHPRLKKGQLFVLIGNKTFSSAKGAALQLRSKTDAILVGSPIPQCPNSFGEVRKFKSPNFGIPVYYSTKFFIKLPGADDQDRISPDLLVPTTITDWKTGHDPVLEAALNYSSQ